jgi:hypothetical protein
VLRDRLRMHMQAAARVEGRGSDSAAATCTRQFVAHLLACSALLIAHSLLLSPTAPSQ